MIQGVDKFSAAGLAMKFPGSGRIPAIRLEHEIVKSNPQS
jgi:hypothetical protein